MKRSWFIVTILLLTFFGNLGILTPQSHARSEETIPDEILVKFKDGTPENTKSKIHRANEAKVKHRVSQLGVEVVEIPRSKVNDSVFKYKKEAAVEYAEPNYIASALEETTDPELPNQWGMYKIMAASSGESAWQYSKSDASIKIAILDTGIDQDHEDLAAKIVSNNNCTNSPTDDDLYGHGTHVAGIAAAITNNSVGVAGVGYGATLMNVKVLGDDGYGAYSWIATCLTWAADNGAKVINMSLGAPYKSRTLENAVKYAWNKGVVLAAAAGNSGNSSPTYPAYYANVIAVAATDENDRRASWSSYGKWVDVAAPGVNIFSTFPNHTYVIGKNLGYDFGSGTSMSTPQVAGLAALVWSTPYGTSNSQVRNRIESTADKISGTGRYWAWGRINTLKAVK